MSVRQVKKSEITKDGKSWVFNVTIYDTFGNKKRYGSKKFASKQEAQEAEIDFLSKVKTKEINITDMTFKDLYDEFYEYKSDKVKATTMRTYVVNSRPLEIFWNLKIRDFTVQHYIKWRQDLVKQNLELKMVIIKSLKNYLTIVLSGMTLISLLYIIKWKSLPIQMLYLKKWNSIHLRNLNKMYR